MSSIDQPDQIDRSGRRDSSGRRCLKHPSSDWRAPSFGSKRRFVRSRVWVGNRLLLVSGGTVITTSFDGKSLVIQDVEVLIQVSPMLKFFRLSKERIVATITVLVT